MNSGPTDMRPVVTEQAALDGREEMVRQLLLVEVKGLKKAYGLKPVLRGLDLTLDAGESLAVLGANGAGKTTLLRILAGLTQPNAGTVSIAGLDSTQHAQEVRRLVGFVGHQPYLYEELTALENLLFFGRMYSVEHVQERAQTLLSKVGLAKRVRERVGTFSRGQLQRLAWARALLHAPRLLLLDEPDTGLDQDGSALIATLWQEHAKQGGSTLFTTHQLDYALTLATCIMIIGSGRSVYQQETQGLDEDALREVYHRMAK